MHTRYVAWGRWTVYNVEMGNQARVRRDACGYEVRVGGVRLKLKISDWSDRQRELRR